MAERKPYPSLARDYERLPETLAGLHYLAFACLMLPHLTDAMNIVQNMLRGKIRKHHIATITATADCYPGEKRQADFDFGCMSNPFVRHTCHRVFGRARFLQGPRP